MLTQELQRTRLDAVRSASSSQVPQTQRTVSNGSARATLDRNLSSNSISHRIDEDQELFDMDFDREPKSTAITAAFPSSPSRESAFGPIGGGRTTK
jgi:hypothetical protein